MRKHRKLILDTSLRLMQIQRAVSWRLNDVSHRAKPTSDKTIFFFRISTAISDNTGYELIITPTCRPLNGLRILTVFAFCADLKLSSFSKHKLCVMTEQSSWWCRRRRRRQQVEFQTTLPTLSHHRDGVKSNVSMCRRLSPHETRFSVSAAGCCMLTTWKSSFEIRPVRRWSTVF